VLALDTFEIRDDDINVEEIMQKIRENIKRRKENGAYIDADIVDINSNRDHHMDRKDIDTSSFEKNIKNGIDNLNWDIQNNNYRISSHRPIVGRPLVKGRELVHGEVRRYVDPVIWKQNEFNKCIKGLLNNIALKIIEIDEKVSKSQAFLLSEMDQKVSKSQAFLLSEIDQKVSKSQAFLLSEMDQKVSKSQEFLLSEMDDKISKSQAFFLSEMDEKISKSQAFFLSEMDEKISKNRAKLSGELDEKISSEQANITSSLEEYIKTCIFSISDDIESKIWLATVLNDKNPIKKQDEHRLSKIFDHQESCIFNQEIGKIWTTLSGKSVDTPNIFEEAIGVFRGSKNILDIGCGSGYFLRRMAQNEIGGYGIDLNEVLVENCKKMGCNAVTSDALSHLQSIEDKSLDGMFMNQVAEHMSSDYLLELLKIGYEKLQNGSYIIISIPNIISMLVSANLFYLDPTHLNHIHPDVIKIFLKLCGFAEIREKFYQPIPDEIKLKKLEISNYLPDGLIKIAEVHNDNISVLNEIIFGHRDCAIYAKKE